VRGKGRGEEDRQEVRGEEKRRGLWGEKFCGLGVRMVWKKKV
jgi:hypothetical protein